MFLFLLQALSKKHSENNITTAQNNNAFLDPSVLYELPIFTCNTLDNTLAFTLQVQNVDPTSVVVDRQPLQVHIKFTSIGSGYVPIPYSFCVKLPIQCVSIIDTEPDVWDNNVILQIVLANSNFNLYSAGLDPENLKEFSHELNCNRIATSAAVVNTSDLDLDEAINIEVRSLSKEEVKIEITNSNIIEGVVNDASKADTAVIPTNRPHKPKRNKRKNKKQRSFSESHCDELEDELKVHEENILKKQLNKNKTRTLSESSTDDQVVAKCREFKSILKRRSSYNRSISESSVDDQHYGCSMDIGVGSIPEEEDLSLPTLSESCKKTVRFDNNIRKQVFR